MIQRTLFNKLTLDRIEEVFAHHFPAALPQQIEQWRGELSAGSVEGRQFFVSVNEQFEMDGILLYEVLREAGVIFALNPEVVKNLIERVQKVGVLRKLTGDSRAVQWADEANLLA